MTSTGPEVALDLSAVWRPAATPEELLRECERTGHDNGAVGRLVTASQAAAALHWSCPELRERVGTGVHVTGADTLSGVLGEHDATGLYLSGRWPAVAGAGEAAWLVLPCRWGRRAVLTLVPAASVRIETVREAPEERLDHVVVCDDVAVDAEQVVDVSGMPSARGSVTWSYPLVVRQAATGIVLGIARRALREFVATARHRSRLGSVERMAEQAVLQRELNRVVQGFRSARELLLAETRNPAAAPATLSRGGRVRIAAAQLHAQQSALAAVRFGFTKAGGSALYSGHPLERAWREAEELSGHPLFGPEAEREVARAQFGGYPRASVL